MFKIFVLNNELNDATQHYINIIKSSLMLLGYDIVTVSSISKIDSYDKVITITPHAFIKVYLHNKRQFVIHWFQGILPEEAIMGNSLDLKSNLRFIYFSLIEFLILRKSKFNFFVSLSMKKHYEKKYRYKNDNYYLMPCFNQLLNRESFIQEKYQEPTFVYAGSLSKWQCINETLNLFFLIQTKIPSAKLFIYTNEQEKAMELLRTHKIETNCTVGYVPYEFLNDKLKNIKYGFLIREDIKVNNVATPTKMNSYLANGIIPIYTNVIDDFKINLHGHFLINGTIASDLLNKVIEMEDSKIISQKVFQEYYEIFDNYYNENDYIQEISKKLKQYVNK